MQVTVSDDTIDNNIQLLV